MQKKYILPRFITSLDDLKEAAKDRSIDCYIMLNGGLRSSKDIRYHSQSQTWDIVNHIDDSGIENIGDDELQKETHIVQAIEQKALVFRSVNY